jgi:transposase
MGTGLSDAQWQRIQPLLPAPKPTGRPRADDRRTLNGILYVLRPGCRWRKDLPDRYGSSVTCWRRLGPVANGRYLGKDLAGLPDLPGRSREAGLEPNLSGWQLRTG